MADTNFVDGTTVIVANWLNDVNDAVYTAIGNGTTAPTTAANVRTNLGLTAAGGAALIGNTPAGDIAATTVQAAIDELDTEKASSAALSADTGSSLSGHIASGTGAVATTVQEVLRETVSVTRFGAVGDGATDDTVAVQAALTHLSTVGGGVLIYPAGKTYKQNGSLLMHANTHISAYGATIDCDDLVYSTTVSTFGAAFHAEGTLVATTTLSSTVTQNATSIVVASATGISVGNIIRLLSDELAFAESGINYYKLDVNRVKKISGTTITLESPCADTLSVSGQTVTVVAYTPVENVSIRGATILGGGYKEALANGLGQCAVVFNGVRNGVIEDCDIRGFQGIAVNCGISLDVECRNTLFFGADNDLSIVEGTSSGFYAFYPSYSRRVKLVGCTGVRSRHLGDAVRSIDVMQENNTAVDTWRAAYGTHGLCWNVTVQNNTANGCHTGTTVRGVNTRVENNTFDNLAERGVDSTANNYSEAEVLIRGNTMVVLGGASGQAGIGIDLRSDYESITITGNTIRTLDDAVWIRSNNVVKTTIANNPELSSTEGQAIVIGDDVTLTVLNQINGLVIEHNGVSAPNAYLPIYLNGSQTATAKAKNIRVANNVCRDSFALADGGVIAANSAVGSFSGPVVYSNNSLLGGGTELVASPNDFTTWAATRSTVTANTTTSPAGDSTADTLTDTATAGTHFLRQTIAVTAGLVYKLGVFAKQGTLRDISLSVEGGFTTGSSRFDLVTGDIEGPTGTYDNLEAFPLLNGWFYFAITATAATTTNGLFTIFLSNPPAGTSYTGDGTGTVHLWQGSVKQVPLNVS